MILSINYLCKILYFIVSVSFFFLSGCAQHRETAALVVSPMKEIRVAVLPLENLSGKTASFKEIRQSMIDRIKMMGVSVLGEEATSKFMSRHRMRYVGGINAVTAQAFTNEEEVDAVLITSLELYNEEYPPKFGVISRLVSTGARPVILWMDSVGLAGDDSPGILGLGLIEDPVKLRDKALSLLSNSLEEFFAGKGDRLGRLKGKWGYRPKIFYRSPFIETGKTYTVAVMPFFNKSERRNAGEILLLHFVNELVHHENFIVIEPGLIRQLLLNVRVIMYEGISLSDADLIANSFNANLVLGGKVNDYYDSSVEDGNPKVKFSLMAIERMSKKVIWASDSYNSGNDNVLFFDFGKLNTASTLASEMARAVTTKMSGHDYQEDEQVEFMDVR